MKPILTSILDNDLYKFSMQYAVLQLFPTAKVRYKLIVRSKVDFPEGFAENLREQIRYMEDLKLQPAERTFFASKCGYIAPTYFDYLSGYRYNSSEVGVIQNGGVLELNAEGYWSRAILWEVPLMAVISELFFIMTGEKIKSTVERQQNNQRKAALCSAHSIHLSDFGTRRRYSFEVQREVVEELNRCMTRGLFTGTSNVYLAFLYNLTPLGTEAHEWFMFHAAKYGFQMANELGLKHWSDVYQGDLGTALTDTFTSDSFFKSFGKMYSKLYDGVRHDSGDPYQYADKTINHYKGKGINPAAKSIIFSNALEIDENAIPEKNIVTINRHCLGSINAGFGVGTSLSNDVGVKPLNMVIKMVAAKPTPEDEWIPTIKLSDDLGKVTGDEKMIDVCKYLLNIK